LCERKKREESERWEEVVKECEDRKTGLGGDV